MTPACPLEFFSPALRTMSWATRPGSRVSSSCDSAALTNLLALSTSPPAFAASEARSSTAVWSHPISSAASGTRSQSVSTRSSSGTASV